jgi:hypothetical protein
VWYAFTAPASERVVARLRAGGDLDAQLSVFLRQRSQAQALGCDRTDARGLAQLAFRTTAGAGYLVRVEQRANRWPPRSAWRSAGRSRRRDRRAGGW